MIQIYFAYADILTKSNPDVFIRQLSAQARSKFSLLKRDEDKDLLLLTSILLSKVLCENGFDDFKLSSLLYSGAGRPFFADSPFDFNISHTDNCAALVFSKNCRVGIDVERIKEIDFSDFTNYFTSDQWEDISCSEDKLKRFYYYWTLIESAVKADGRGLSLISSKSIKLINGYLFIDDLRWYYNHYNFDKSISCCVTTAKKNKSYEIKKIISI